jgi:DNA invertase Pin-like site-specific DNA recombinase
MTAPAAPAAYVRAAAARSTDDPAITRQCDHVLAAARALGWPEPVGYADAGPAVSTSASRFTVLAVAIIEGRHDAVIMTDLARISRTGADAVAFAHLCHQHGAVLQLTSGEQVTEDTAALHARL